MAIFGRLEKISLLDTLAMLRQRSGTLELSELQVYHDCHISLESGTLRGLIFDTRVITNPDQAQDAISTLMHLNHGRFVFNEDKMVETASLNIPLRKVFMWAKFDSIRERQLTTSASAPQTVFTLTNEQVDWEDDRLLQFFKQVEPYLRQGANAETLAEHLNIKTEYAQTKLYQLRLLNCIEPVRAYRHDAFARAVRTGNAKQADSPNSKPSKNQKPSFIRGLIKALRLRSS